MEPLHLPGDSKIKIHFLWAIIVVALVSCVQIPQAPTESAKSNVPETTSNETPATSEPYNSQTMSTPQSTETPGIQPIQIPNQQEAILSQSTQPALVTQTATITTTPSLDDVTITGQLFVFEPGGIHQINLPDKESTNLFETENDLSDWGARFAQNKKLLAYWIKQDSGTEFWFTPLPEWQPELLLTVNDMEYDFATLLWGVNDRYLFFLLSVLDDSGPLEDIKTVRTYIIDTETLELVGASYWPGECLMLAPSPSSGQITLWCNQADEQEYLVLEPEQVPWLTKETPNALIDNCNTYASCDWSQDGEFVVYIDEDKYPEEIYYSSINHPQLIRLNDGISDSYTFPLWSPNSQFLYYSGRCTEGGLANPTIMRVVDQEIFWCVKDTSNRGEFGILDVSTVSWSPNSSFLAILILPSEEYEILIFDITYQKEQARISGLDTIVMDMVWVEN